MQRTTLKEKLFKIANRAYILFSIIMMATLVYYNFKAVLIEITKDKHFTTAHETLEKAKLSLKENRERTYIEAAQRIRERSDNSGNSKFRDVTSPIDEQCFDSSGNGIMCEYTEIGKFKIRSHRNYGIHQFEPAHILSTFLFAVLYIFFGVVILYVLKKWVIWMMPDDD
jgi:hypothetical protein